ncbi:MAG: hypothetical protein QM755_24340 [Luteolibacter sp.]
MGAALVSQVVDSIDSTFDKAVFSFIPNTAETAYYGLMDGLRLYRRQEVRSEILKAADAGKPDRRNGELILRNWPCGEKLAHKDIKMRTFISQEKGATTGLRRLNDITYGIVKPR